MHTIRRIFHSRRIKLLCAGATLLVVAGLVQIEARVYVLTDDALVQAFPGAETERKAKYLSKAQQAELRQLADLERIGRFHTFYIARKNGQVQGYALFDTHIVRTKEETVFVALNADGSVRTARIVSFFEPQEYLAPDRWLNIFQNKSARDDLRPGRDLPSISGATLTTRAVSTAVRKTLHLHRVHFGGR
ncbi:MAG: FMN-binding protein [bacterium]|nr:FMN-binding protein [bacterium]